MNYNFKGWTLFLDRDGVINEKIENDYVKKWSEFKFCRNALIAICNLSKIFERIIIVTNQKGIGRKLYTKSQLKNIHRKMLIEIEKFSGKIDMIYFCPDIEDSSICRKPNTGMGLQAKDDFPDIEFSKSIIVGDSITDMQFGRKLGMKRVLITPNVSVDGNFNSLYFDMNFKSLFDFSQECTQINFN